MVFSTFESTVSRENFAEEADFRSYEILLRFGYKWNVTPKLSIGPWFSAGPIWSDTDSAVVGGEKFSEAKVQVIGTVHMTYELMP